MQQESILENVIKNVRWSQESLEGTQGVRFPKIQDFGEATLVEPKALGPSKARRKRSIGTSVQ